MAKAVAISNPLIDAFLAALDARLEDIMQNSPDKVPLLVDAVNPDVLPLLAAQFDVLGYNGWKLATTDQQRRDLIKTAIERHRYRGTRFSIKSAMEAVGYGTAQIFEGVEALYNGFITFDGVTTYGSLNWAHFAVLVDLGEQAGVSVGLLTDLVAMINANKNARSLLVNLSYGATLSDDAPARDRGFESFIATTSLSDNGFPPILYDGVIDYDGTSQFNSAGEILMVVAGLADLTDSPTATDAGGTIKLIDISGLTLTEPL